MATAKGFHMLSLGLRHIINIICQDSCYLTVQQNAHRLRTSLRCTCVKAGKPLSDCVDPFCSTISYNCLPVQKVLHIKKFLQYLGRRCGLNLPVDQGRIIFVLQLESGGSLEEDGGFAAL